MKLKLMLIFILLQSVAVFAFDKMPDITPASQMTDMIKGLLILGTISGVIPGVIFLVIYFSIRGCIKTGKKLSTTDYSPVSVEDGRKRMLDALEE
jgi:hypothetical protein